MPFREESSTILDARFLVMNGAEPLNGFPMGAPNGSMVSPPFSFESNSGTGMSLISDVVTFGVDGVSSLVVGMEGNVSVGDAPVDYGVTTSGEGVLFLNQSTTLPTGVINGGNGGGVLGVDGTSLKYTDAVNGSVIKLTSKTGDVVGSVSSTLNSVVVFDGVTGKLIKDSPLLVTGASTLQAPDGSNGLNTYAFTGDEDTGMNLSSGLNIVNGGSAQVNVGATLNIAVTGVESHVPDGSVGSPGYSFTSHPTSGLFLSGTDVNVSVNGVTGLVVEDVGGAVPNVSFSSAPSDYGAGTPGVGVLFLPQASVEPSGVPNSGSGSVVFVSSNELKMVNSGGVVRDLTNCVEETSGTTTLDGVVRFSGTTGKLLQDTSTLTVDTTGQWGGPDGSLATTTYGFTGDTNTGMYSSGVGVVDLVTNSTSRVSATSTEVTVNNVMLLPNGSASQPSYSFTSAPSSGVYWDSATDSVCISSQGECAVALFENGNLTSGGDPLDQFGGGEGVWWLRQAGVAPSTNPSSGSLLYTTTTELFLRTPSGTVFNLTDEITGPGSATDEALVIYSGTSGKVVQNSLVTGTDAGRLNSGDGSVSLPAYSFSSDVDSGMYISGTDLYLTHGGGIGGVGQVLVDGSTVSLASQFQVPYGTTSTPSWSFTGDANTGLYHGFTNRVTTSVGGTAGLAMEIAGVGTNVSLTGTTSFGGGENVVFIEEVGVSPVGTLTSGGILYVSGTDLMFHDDGGGVSTLNSSPTSSITGPLSSVVDSVAYWDSTNGTTFTSGTVASTTTQTTSSGYYVNDSGASITNDTSRLTFTSGVGELSVGSGGVEVSGVELHADSSLRVGGAGGVQESLSGSVFTSNHLNAAGTFEWRRDGSQIVASSGLDLTTPNSYVFPVSTEIMDMGNTSGTTYTVASTTSDVSADDISLSVDGTTRVLFEQSNSVLGNAMVFPLERTAVTTRMEAPDGTIASPSYTFDSAPGSGMLYDSATSSVGVCADGKLAGVISDAGAGVNVAFAVSSFPTTYNGGEGVMYIGEAVTEATSDIGNGILMHVNTEDDLRKTDAVADASQNCTLNSMARRSLSTLSYSPSSGSTVELDGFVWTDVDSAGVSTIDVSNGIPKIVSVNTTVMVILHAVWDSNATGYRKISITTGGGPYTVEATSTVNAVNGDVTSHTVTLIRRIAANESGLPFVAQIFQNSGVSLNADMTMSLVRMN